MKEIVEDEEEKGGCGRKRGNGDFEGEGLGVRETKEERSRKGGKV